MGKTTNSNKNPGTSSTIPAGVHVDDTEERRSSGTRRAGEVQELRVVSVSPP
jgi:hypothetical protein